MQRDRMHTNNTAFRADTAMFPGISLRSSRANRISKEEKEKLSMGGIVPTSLSDVTLYTTPWFPQAEFAVEFTRTEEHKTTGEDKAIQKFSDKALSEFFAASPGTRLRPIPATPFYLSPKALWDCESLKTLMMRIQLVHVTQVGMAAENIRSRTSKDRVFGTT